MKNCNFIILFLLMTMVLYTGCDQPPEENPSTSVGVFLIRNPGQSSLEYNIMDNLETLGIKTLGLYMGPKYQKYYPGISDRVNNLKELAEQKLYRQLFSSEFDTFVINVYSFSSGFDIFKRLNDCKYRPGQAYLELKDLALFLNSAYPEKRFIFKNCNSDLLHQYGSEKSFQKNSVILKKWFEERISAVNETTFSGKRNVFSAVEFDYVEPSSTLACVLTDIVPQLSPDLYSYSGRRLNTQLEKLPLHLEWISYFTKPSPSFGKNNLIIGGLGIVSKTPRVEAQKLKWFFRQCREARLPFIMYFQAYSSGGGSYPVFNNDSEPTLVWLVIREFIDDLKDRNKQKM